MLLKLRIILTILSALCAAAVLPIGTFFDLPWAIATALGGVLFFLLMLLVKQEQEKREPPKEENSKESTTEDEKND